MSRQRPLDRRALFASATAAALLAASGVSAASVPRRGGRLRMALSGASRTDSWTRGAGLFMQVARQGLVFDTLTEIGADGTLRGELASSWTPFDGARVWQFDLRRDVTFHDGAPFTSADVVASAAGFADGNVTAAGRHAVIVHLASPDPSLPMRLAAPEFYISAAHAPASGIGTGLYKVGRFAPGQQLLVTRVAAHYKGNDVGWFEEVELVSVPAETVRAEALGGYMVDAADLTQADAIAGLADVTGQPGGRRLMQAVSRDLGQPAQVGFQRPMDNLRAAERWWFA
ncbi:MAG: ABC transporter substrate-binding protein [Pseudomonadota bacterium]